MANLTDDQLNEIRNAQAKYGNDTDAKVCAFCAYDKNSMDNISGNEFIERFKAYMIAEGITDDDMKEWAEMTKSVYYDNKDVQIDNASNRLLIEYSEDY